MSLATYKCFLKSINISPRKARLVADLVRGKNVQEALDCLKHTNKRAAPVISKMIVSAMANATNQATVDVDSFVVSAICVDEGPTQKRFLPRAQGRATVIRKRSSHIAVELSEL